MTNPTLVFNRFRPDSVGGRILSTLADGKPKSVAQLARVAKPRSVENITAPGGWYAQLRAYGKATRKFTLSKTDDGKLQLTASKTRSFPRHAGAVNKKGSK